MNTILFSIEQYESILEKEFKELVLWTLGLDEEYRQDYLYFSIKQRLVRLRLQRRIANRREEYELCAAVNRHLKKLNTLLEQERPS